MAEEMEIIEGAEATEEELQAANEEFEPEVIELTEEELNEVAGGRQLKSSGPSRSVYCPWHHAYEQCTPCGRFI